MDHQHLTGSIEAQLILVKQGDDRFLKTLYESRRPGFVAWFQKNYRLDHQQAVDLFQKAFSAFYFNVKDGKIVTLHSSIDTYLYGIGKMMMKEAYREAKKMSMVEDVNDITLMDYSIFNEEDLSHERSVVKDIMNRLEDPCKKLLTLYYFKNYSLESIAESLGYKNQGVVKKKKCLCLKSIRTMLTELKWRG